MNATESEKSVNPIAAMISLAAIIITIVLGLKLGWGAQMSVFAAAIVSALLQIVRTVQKRPLVGNIEFLSGVAQRERRHSSF